MDGDTTTEVVPKIVSETQTQLKKKSSRFVERMIEFLKCDVEFLGKIKSFVQNIDTIKNLYVTYYLKNKKDADKIDAIFADIHEAYSALISLHNSLSIYQNAIITEIDTAKKLNLFLNYIESSEFKNKVKKLGEISIVYENQFVIPLLRDKTLIKEQSELTTAQKLTVQKTLKTTGLALEGNDHSNLITYLDSIFIEPLQKFQRYSSLLDDMVKDADKEAIIEEEAHKTRLKTMQKKMREDLNNLEQTQGRKTRTNSLKTSRFFSPALIPAPGLQIFFHNALNLCDFALQTGKGKQLAVEYSLEVSQLSSEEKKLVQRIKNYLLIQFYNLYQTPQFKITEERIKNAIILSLQRSQRFNQSTNLFRNFVLSIQSLIDNSKKNESFLLPPTARITVKANTPITPVKGSLQSTVQLSDGEADRQMQEFHQFISKDMNEIISKLLITNYTKHQGIHFGKNAWKTRLVDNIRKALINIDHSSLQPHEIWQKYVDIIYDALDSVGQIPYTQMKKGRFKKCIDKTIKYLDGLCPNLMFSAKDKFLGKKDNADLIELVKQARAIRPKEECKTPENLLCNILRINDYYSNNNLGKMMADDKDIPQNDKMRWKNDIAELSQKASKIYFTFANPDSVILLDGNNTLDDKVLEKNRYYLNKQNEQWELFYLDASSKKTIIDCSNIHIDSLVNTNTQDPTKQLRDTLAISFIQQEIKNTGDSIRKKTLGRNSRLVNSLSIVFRAFYNGKASGALQDIEDVEPLPSGVISINIPTKDAEDYIKLHHLEQVRERQKRYESHISKWYIRAGKFKADASAHFMGELFNLKKNLGQKSPLEFITCIREVFTAKLNSDAYQNINPLYFRQKFGEVYSSIIQYLFQIAPEGHHQEETLKMYGPPSPEKEKRSCGFC